ncbi:MAG: ammonia-forming cytochrome c nitrite reductase subunit c552 [Pseudomonadales bacterium]|nr:ammonia-forming cytochrome c nitrite reductase subunit c552 [Pseudomonadales bacterium]
MAELAAHWSDAPPMAVCVDCQRVQARTFALGRHGMRGHPKIAKPRDPQRALSDLGLEAQRVDHLDCGSCHESHNVDTRYAAVDACATCHADSHTRAYFESPHDAKWREELAGTAPAGAGVSCATCHMTKTERRGNAITSHNQNDNLRPNEKMIRSVCLDCHGLQFSLDALTDTRLIEANFTGKPKIRVESRLGSATHTEPPGRRRLTSTTPCAHPYLLQRNATMDRRSVSMAALFATLATAVVASEGVPYQRVTDMLYQVMSADREVYRMVVQRLTVDDDVLTASEHYDDDVAAAIADVPLRRRAGHG